MHIIDPTREQFSVRLAGFVTILIWLICSLVNVPYLMSFELVDGSYYTQNSNATPFCGQVSLFNGGFLLIYLDYSELFKRIVSFLDFCLFKRLFSFLTQRSNLVL